MTTVFHARANGRFIEIQSNLRRKKLHRMNQGSHFLGGTFSKRSNLMKRGIPLWIWWKVNGNWDNNMSWIYQWRKAIVEQVLASEEINKSNIQQSRTVRTVCDQSRKVNRRSKVVWDRKLITEFTISISSTRRNHSLWWTLVSKDNYISRWVVRENLIYVRIKNRAQRRRRWLIKKKEVKQWVR